jgi:hypothetical protein
MIFKDPFQPGETPYEIPGLQPDASPAELKTAADRAQVDIWLYHVDTTSAGFVSTPLDLPKVASCPVDQLYSDLSSGEPYQINLDDLKHYDLPELD